MEPSYSDSVFINCPFDESFQTLFNAIIFTIYRCGFIPRSALEDDNATEMRMEKIFRLIEKSKYGIHDISRTEIDKETNLPRFNMPFELGVFWGAKKFGGRKHKDKNMLITERDQFSYQKYFSDLNGVDVKAHKGKVDLLISSIRNWLSTSSGRKTIPTTSLLIRDYNDFMKSKLPIMLSETNSKLSDLTFNDFCTFIQEGLTVQLDQN